MKIRFITFFLLLNLLFMVPVSAQETTLESQRSLTLSLQTCLLLTLKYNLTLLDLRLTPGTNQELVIQQETVFDPQLAGSISHKDAKTPRASRLFGTLFTENQTTSEVSLNKRFSRGTETSISMSHSRDMDSSPFRDLKPSHTARLALSVSQPLLKNFGWQVNNSTILIALNNHKISSLTLQRSINNELSNTIMLYWELVFACQNLQVQQILLTQAEGLLSLNQAKVAAGVLAPLVITEAKAGVASRQEAIIVAQAAVQDLEDQLLAQTNIASESWDFHIKPSSRAEKKQIKPLLSTLLKETFSHRADYRGRLLGLDNRTVQLRYEQNQTLPELNLNGSLQYTGLDDQIGQSWQDLAGFNFPTWEVGLTFSYPLGNRQANSLVLQKRLEKQQGEIQLKRMKQQIILEVRRAHRELTTGWQRIKATEAARTLEQEKLRIEEEKLKAGLSTNQRILDFQSDLATSKVSYLKAVIGYNKARAKLYLATGTLMEKHAIKITEAPKKRLQNTVYQTRHD